MSDFLFSSRRRPPGELAAVLARWLGHVAGVTREVHGEWGSLAVFLPPHEAHALVEENGRISVLVGNPLVRLPGLPPRLVHHAPRRERMHALAFDPDSRLEHALDGHFALLAVDPAGSSRVLTDRFAFVPVFEVTTGDGVLLGTHIDALAHVAGCDVLDPVSIADFTVNITCTTPYTVYREVRQLDAGSEYRFGRAGRSVPVRCYWRPAEAAAPPSLAAAAGALREALCEGVAAAVDGDERAAVLLSGGEDSRVVLGAVPRRVRVRAATWAERENREVRTARSVARAYGAELVVGWRTPDHYARHFRETAALVGSHHNFIDVHGYALSAALGLESEPVVLGGLSADSLLKLHHLPGASGRYRSPRVPGVDPALLDAADERRAEFARALHEIRPDTAAEWLQLWPFAMRKHGGNVDGNRRLFRSFEAFHTTAVLELAASVPTAWKRDRALFRAAFRPLLRPARLVPHTEYRFPYYGRLGNLLLLPPLALGRGLGALARGELRARQRSWPKWRSVAAALAPDEAAVLAASPVAALIARDPVALRDALPDWQPLRRFVLAQLAFLQLPDQPGSSRNSPVAMSSTVTRPSSMM